MATLNEIWALYPTAHTIDVVFTADKAVAISSRAANMLNWFLVSTYHGGHTTYTHGDSNLFELKAQSWTSGPLQSGSVPMPAGGWSQFADERVYGDFTLPGHCSKCAGPLKAVQLFTSTVEVCPQCERKAS